MTPFDTSRCEPCGKWTFSFEPGDGSIERYCCQRDATPPAPRPTVQAEPQPEPPLVCEVCGATNEVVRTMMFDLCPGCLAALHFEHQCFAASRGRG